MSANPTQTAATRNESLKCSAELVISDWVWMRAAAGPSITIANPAVASVEAASTVLRSRTGSILTKLVNRMCALRRTAITAPIMPSQRNSACASSSLHTKG